MILGDEVKGQSGESRECWSKVCSAVLKQGELESVNNSRISKAMANFNESHGNQHVCSRCMAFCSHVYVTVYTDDILKALSILPYLLPDARSKVVPDKFITFYEV